MRRILYIFFAFATLLIISFSACSSSKNGVKGITQHEWGAYDWVDTCNAKYAVVHGWTGRCGLYDLENHCNITELEYRNIRYAPSIAKKLSREGYETFWAEQGYRSGVLTIDPTGGIMSILVPDDDMYHSLDSCQAIDTVMTTAIGDILRDSMKTIPNSIYGQVVVLDSRTYDTKVWVAMEDEMNIGNISESRLKKNTVSKAPLSMLVGVEYLMSSDLEWTDVVDTKKGVDTFGGGEFKDPKSWKGKLGKLSYLEAFKKHSNIAIGKALETHEGDETSHFIWYLERSRTEDPTTIASLYNLIANQILLDKGFISTDDKVQTMMDSLEVPKKYICTCHEILKGALEDGYGSAWTTKEVSMAGYYTTMYNCAPSLLDDNLKDMDLYRDGKLRTYDQAFFVGYLPADNPRYTFCVTLDKKGKEIKEDALGGIVNSIALYLNNLK